MKTIEESILEQIEKLSELELSELMQNIADHLARNKMLHLIRGIRNEELQSMEELEDRVQELEKDLEEAENKLEDIRMIL